MTEQPSKTASNAQHNSAFFKLLKVFPTRTEVILRAHWCVICQKNSGGVHYGWFEGFHDHAIYGLIIFRESCNTNFGTPCSSIFDCRDKSTLHAYSRHRKCSTYIMSGAVTTTIRPKNALSGLPRHRFSYLSKLRSSGE